MGQSPDPGSFWAPGSLRRVGFGAADDGPEFLGSVRGAADAGGGAEGAATGAGGAGSTVAMLAGGASGSGGDGAMAAGAVAVDACAGVRLRRATPMAKTRLAETAAIAITKPIRTGGAGGAAATGGAGRGVVMPDGVGVCAIRGDAGIASGGAGAGGAGGGSESWSDAALSTNAASSERASSESSGAPSNRASSAPRGAGCMATGVRPNATNRKGEALHVGIGCAQLEQGRFRSIRSIARVEQERCAERDVGVRRGGLGACSLCEQ